MEKYITMAHGDGGELSHQLIQDIFVKPFKSDKHAVYDAATMPWTDGEIVVSTDSFVVKPLFFPGGNIGKLAVAGTVNDLAVSGACPRFLTCGFILEEGFSIKLLQDIVKSMKQEADAIGLQIIAGDTKVVEKGSADGLYINTTGIGYVGNKRLKPNDISIGDSVLINGTIGDHGIAIMTARNDLGIMNDVQSDCAVLSPMIEELIQHIPSIRIMRDPTRGGLATSLVEIAEDFNCTIVLNEKDLPVKDSVHGACDIMGFDPLYLANEGKVIIIVPHGDEQTALKVMRKYSTGTEAVKIGEVTAINQEKGKLLLQTPLLSKRKLNRLAGVMLPRIC